ncbi:hypothetical protein ANN_02729 [Periplaneta americana]|uniref:Uncharacterized protein n=1 Tax=Periplaneta americana TaxID=6978 RepID=A0ABQ8TY85_PERAM|nr:hypothetical protein ANN_02729 [Periplaneta americana]
MSSSSVAVESTDNLKIEECLGKQGIRSKEDHGPKPIPHKRKNPNRRKKQLKKPYVGVCCPEGQENSGPDAGDGGSLPGSEAAGQLPAIDPGLPGGGPGISFPGEASAGDASSTPAPDPDTNSTQPQVRGEEYNACSSALCNFLHSPMISPLLQVNLQVGELKKMNPVNIMIKILDKLNEGGYKETVKCRGRNLLYKSYESEAVEESYTLDNGENEP